MQCVKICCLYLFIGKRVQETICLSLNIILLIFDFYHLVVNFKLENWYAIFGAARK